MRVFFVLSGIIGAALAVATAAAAKSLGAAIFLPAIMISFSIAYLLIGFWFRSLIRDRPHLILRVLRISLVFGGLGVIGLFMQSIRGEASLGEVLAGVLQVFFVIYLLANVKRLAAEAAVPSEGPILHPAAVPASQRAAGSREEASRPEYSPE